MRVALAAALLGEPAFQASAAWSGGMSAPAAGVVGAHLLVFGALQLWLLLRFDLLSMLAMRLVYYLWWHGVWGWLRLELLF